MPAVAIFANPSGVVPKGRGVLQSTAVVEFSYTRVASRRKSRTVYARFNENAGVKLYLWPDGGLRVVGSSSFFPYIAHALLVSHDARRIRYVHRANGLAYEHDFERGAVTVTRLADQHGSFQFHFVRPDGLPLYKFFPGATR